MAELIIIVLICLVSYVLILRDFDFSVYVLIVLSVLLHKELFSFFKWDLMPIRGFMLALLAAGITKVIFWLFKDRDWKKLKVYIKDPIIIYLILLWVIRLISIVNSKNMQSSFQLLGFFTTIVMLVILIYSRYKTNPIKILSFLRFYIYTVFALTLFGWFQLYLYSSTGKIIGALWNIPGNIPRVGATFWDVNHYGALLSALIPLLGILIVSGKNLKIRLLDFCIFISMVGALFLTNSRSAWIMASAALLSFVSLMIFRKIGTKGVIYLVLALILVSLPFLREYSVKSSPFRARIKQYFHYRLDSFDSHFLLLTGAYQIFEKYPLIGAGYGSFFEHFSATKIAPTYFSRDPAALNTRVPAHTIWGELLAETGVLGLTAYLIFISTILFSLLFGALNLQKKNEFLLSAVFFSTILGWMLAGIFYSYNSEFFWLILIFFATWGKGAIYERYGYNKVFSYILRSDKVIFTMVFLLSSCLIFINLGKNHLIPYDEAIYAKISKNMVISGQYFVQEWKPKSIWYEKPPLYMWMVSASQSLLGFTSLAARLPSAFMGLMTISLIYFMGRKLFNKTTGFISALALLTTTQYLYYSRAAMTDVTTTFFITSSLVSYYFFRNKKKIYLWIIPGLLTGLAVMTKGVVGLLPFPIIVLFEFYLISIKKDENKSRGGAILWLILGWALLALPWHIYMYTKFGNSFINQYLGYHVWDRAVTSIEDKGRPFLWYLTVLKVSMRLWFIVLIGALPFSLYRAYRGNRIYVYLSIWSLFIFLFFSVAKSKLVWYLIPLYPALSLIVGSFISYVLSIFMTKFKKLDTHAFKYASVFLITLTVLVYFFFNRGLVYTSDLTGAEAELLRIKDERFGIKTRVFIDRMDVPLAVYYSDSPFTIIDFRADRYDRIPIVKYDEPMILLTKQGRFSEKVLGYDYEPVVVESQGDWILWYFVSKQEYYSKVNSATVVEPL